MRIIALIVIVMPIVLISGLWLFNNRKRWKFFQDKKR